MSRNLDQRVNRRRRTPLLLLLAALSALAALPTAPATAQPGVPGSAAWNTYQALLARAGGPLDVRWDVRSGAAEFLAARGDGRLPYAPTPAERGDPVAIARGFLDQQRDLFGLRSAASELTLLRIEPDTRLGWAHVRFDQVYRGIPVFGKQLVVHLDTQGRPVAVDGQFAPGIDLPTEPLLSAGQAANVALDDLRDMQLAVAERLSVATRVLSDKTRLVVYVDRAGKPRLAWYVAIMTEAPLGQWRYFVNARRPAVVHAFDSLNEAKRRITFSADNTTDLPGRQLIDEGERSRDPVAQAAHDAAGIVYDYYFKNFKRDSIDGQGSPIVSTVHFGSSEEDAENAAWISEVQQMIYGDGGQIFRPLAYGLDVVGHELTHGVTDHTAQLIYEGQSGALNESYSDVFGALIDDKNWTIGEDVVKSPPFPAPFLRSLEDPNLGGRYDPNNPLSGVGQPAHTDEYANLPLSRRFDNGGVHINSGIPSRAAFLVAQALGREKTGQIYYRTLTQYLTPDADFSNAAAATVRAAQDLYGATEASAVRAAFAQVGIAAGGPDTVPAPAPAQSDLPNIPAQPEQPTQQPLGCSDLIVNGGFESAKSWVEVVAGNVAIIDPELPHSGKRSAWLGGSDQERLQLIYQELRVPPNATSVRLSYFRLIHEELSGLAGVLTPDVTFSTLIANTKGDVLDTVEELSSAKGDDSWRQAEFDLSKFAGKTIRLAFAVETTRGNISSFFVDDVALAACTAGDAAPAPQPASANQVFIEGTVTDADTGRGVDGAQVFILRPGLSAEQAAADDTVSDDEVITSGVSDSNGFYRSGEAIPRGQRYSVIVIAGDYRPIIADDGIDIPRDASNPITADAELRR